MFSPTRPDAAIAIGACGYVRSRRSRCAAARPTWSIAAASGAARACGSVPRGPSRIATTPSGPSGSFSRVSRWPRAWRPRSPRRFPSFQRHRLPSALRRLGFAYVGETAIGAYHTARPGRSDRRRAEPGRQHICTACPAVVRYVERYRPELISALTPVVVAHDRPRQAHSPESLSGEVRVVFIGPCVAKKAEAERPEHAGLIDCVLTFVELHDWLDREGIDLSACEESDFDETPEGNARLFPIEGGSVRTSGWTTDLLAAEVIAASGFEEVCTALDGLWTPDAPRVIEPLFCAHGCTNGPAMLDERNVLAPAWRRAGLCRGPPRQHTQPALPWPACREVQGPGGRRRRGDHGGTDPARAGDHRQGPRRGPVELRRLRLCELPRQGRRGDPRHGRAGNVHPAHEEARRAASRPDHRDQPERHHHRRRASANPAHEPGFPEVLPLVRRHLRGSRFRT